MSTDNDFAAFMASHSTGKPSSTGGKRGRPANPNGPTDLSEKKTSIYLSCGITLDDVKRTAAHCDRSVSWVLSRAYAIARAELESSSPDSE
jgi:hypothetical protein